MSLHIIEVLVYIIEYINYTKAIFFHEQPQLAVFFCTFQSSIRKSKVKTNIMIVSILLVTIFLSSKVVGAYIMPTTTTSFSRSSFVARRRHTLDSFGTPTLQHTASTAAATTTLHMNLFDRFSRVAKSNLNNILQSLEDPEKIMTQALEDMQVRAFVHMILCITWMLLTFCFDCYFVTRRTWSKFVNPTPKLPQHNVDY